MRLIRVTSITGTLKESDSSLAINLCKCCGNKKGNALIHVILVIATRTVQVSRSRLATDLCMLGGNIQTQHLYATCWTVIRTTSLTEKYKVVEAALRKHPKTVPLPSAVSLMSCEPDDCHKHNKNNAMKHNQACR